MVTSISEAWLDGYKTAIHSARRSFRDIQSRHTSNLMIQELFEVFLDELKHIEAIALNEMPTLEVLPTGESRLNR